VGRTVEVLVERAENSEVSGRTRQNRVVIASAPLGAELGTVRRVTIEHATAWQLRGQVLN
jgi:tRNA A37 methylthiotransferase MiaB